MSVGGWYYLDNDARIGPVDRSALEQLISQGTVVAQTLVWRTGMDGWEEAGRHFDCTGDVSPPPPPPPPLRAPTAEATTATPAPADLDPSLVTSAGGLYSGAPARGFREAISVCLRKYITFSGRASRSEYWYFILFGFLVGVATSLIDRTIFGIESESSPIYWLASLALLLPSIAAAVRRLHDTNRSGWWYGSLIIGPFGGMFIIGFMIAVTPYTSGDLAVPLALFAIAILVYAIVLIVFLCKRGDPGPNRFG